MQKGLEQISLRRLRNRPVQIARTQRGLRCAFSDTTPRQRHDHTHERCSVACSSSKIEELNATAMTKRLKQLEQQAGDAMLVCASSFSSPVFPCALIAGDVVILHLLSKFDLLENVTVVFVNTLHLFPETLDFLKVLEERYGFKAQVFTPKRFRTYEAYKAVHGVDLYLRDVEQYDHICKVEPFQRALQETGCDIMINGRRRDHGADRAHLQIFEMGKNQVANCQPLAYWEFADCFAYAEQEGIQLHPLHEQGYPSVGDVQSTVPVPRERWFEYGGERAGRFLGLQNPDGTIKTECGIHTVGEVPEETAGAASRIA